MDFRKSHDLTQADLAERYNVSGPAIFKFEKGFVTPSLRLWQKIAADLGIPEKEAVLLWVKEKLPRKMHSAIRAKTDLDLDALEKDLEKAAKEDKDGKAMRDLIIGHPDITPALKTFARAEDVWNILKPTPAEIMFLIHLDRAYPLLTVDHFRDALLTGRDIQAG